MEEKRSTQYGRKKEYSVWKKKGVLSMEEKRVEVSRVKYQKPGVLLSSKDHAPFSLGCKGGIANCLHCRQL